jgi:hypothetical protein
LRRSLHPKGLNPFEHRPDGTTAIFMTRGMMTIIDTTDFNLVHPYRWTPKPIRRGWYAATGRGPENKAAYLHCFLIGPIAPLEVDHRDGDGLNNRRSNFRLLTHTQNCFNVWGRRRGVTRHPTTNPNRKWAARITRDFKTTSRYFASEREARICRLFMEQIFYPEITRESMRTAP